MERPDRFPAIALVRAAADDLPQENDLVVPFPHRHIEITEASKPSGELGQFMVVRREQSFCSNLMVQVFNNRPCQAQAVEGAGAPANFVKNDQAARSGMVENISRLTHLDHESRLAPRQIVACSNASEDPIQ